MRGVAIDEWGGREVMRLRDDLPAPPVAPDGVLVRVRAAGVNPVDAKVREGYQAQRLPFHFPLVLGWDAAGVVEEVGPAVTWFKPGDEVYGYCRRHHLQFGTYGEYTTVPEGFLAHKPRRLSFEQAAAVPLSALTAHQALDAVGLRGGESLLVGGGAGGVGHFAVQLGVVRGARVIATASERNHQFVRELGGEPVDYRADGAAERILELAGGDGVDAALDVFGGDDRELAFAALRRGGRLVSLAQPPPPPREGYEVHYVFVRPAGDQLSELAQLIDEDRLEVHVEEVFPLERAAEAHERLEDGHVRGKLVLRID
jgi:NADPH:quinone reductase-like Zn-dependent oxidoreductase